jgi:hypothetical protein
MRLSHYYPLLAFIVPTLIIGYGFVIPGSSIEGVNEHTVGFATTLAGAALSYYAGIRSVLRDRARPGAG